MMKYSSSWTRENLQSLAEKIASDEDPGFRDLDWRITVYPGGTDLVVEFCAYGRKIERSVVL